MGAVTEDQAPDAEEGPKLHRLNVVVADPGYFKLVEVGPDPIDALAPDFRRDENGVMWERYGNDDEYIEFPAKLVKLRHLFLHVESEEDEPTVEERLGRPSEMADLNLKGERPR